MSAALVAAGVRARVLLQHRLSRHELEQVARCGSLDAALELLDGWERFPEPPDGDLEAAQRWVAALTLLDIRVLAGWAPRSMWAPLRSLAAWFELVNVEDRLAYFLGGELRPAFQLGALGSAWPRGASTLDISDLRQVLRASAWGDPGSDRPTDIARHLHLTWVRTMLRDAPELSGWALGAVAVAIARGLAGDDRLTDQRPRVPGLGSQWLLADTLEELHRLLPPRAAWPLAEVDESGLWRAEAGWLRRIGHDAEVLARSPIGDRTAVLGAAAARMADMWRVDAALAAAALGGNSHAAEAFDALT